MIDDKLLAERVNGCIFARDWLAVVIPECAQDSFADGFWATVYSHIPKKYMPRIEPNQTLRTFNDEQAKQFEKTDIKFGAHQGLSHRDVPIEYLTWIADKALDLQAYLRSERGRRRIEGGDE